MALPPKRSSSELSEQAKRQARGPNGAFIRTREERERSLEIQRNQHIASRVSHIQTSTDETLKKIYASGTEDGKYWVVDDQGVEVGGPYESKDASLRALVEHSEEQKEAGTLALSVAGPAGLTGDRVVLYDGEHNPECAPGVQPYWEVKLPDSYVRARCSSPEEAQKKRVEMEETWERTGFQILPKYDADGITDNSRVAWLDEDEVVAGSATNVTSDGTITVDVEDTDGEPTGVLMEMNRLDLDEVPSCGMFSARGDLAVVNALEEFKTTFAENPDKFKTESSCWEWFEPHRERIGEQHDEVYDTAVREVIGGTFEQVGKARHGYNWKNDW